LLRRRPCRFLLTLSPLCPRCDPSGSPERRGTVDAGA
jgi:hypothetical protein